MPGYTHLQRAQPVTFAHHLAAYASMFSRDVGRVSDAAGRMELIISTIVRLSESLGFRVVAEYVETPAQLEALGALGCRYYQGYLFSPAIPLSELKKYIREH